MALDYTALKNELNNDPVSLGYSTSISNGDDGSLAGLLNLVRVGAAYSIFRKSVAIRELIANIASLEFASLTALKLQQLNLMFLGTATLDASDTNTRNIMTSIFAGMTTTLSNFAILAKKQSSRAEVLFGEGTTITGNDVGTALRHT